MTLLLKLNSAISTHYLPSGRLPELGNVFNLLGEGGKNLAGSIWGAASVPSEGLKAAAAGWLARLREEESSLV